MKTFPLMSGTRPDIVFIPHCPGGPILCRKTRGKKREIEREQTKQSLHEDNTIVYKEHSRPSLTCNQYL